MLIIQVILFLFLGLAGVYLILRFTVPKLPSGTLQYMADVKEAETPKLMPGSLHITERDGIKLAYESIEPHSELKGTFLFIAGLSQTLLDWPAFFFMPLVESGYRVLRMDNRGLGESDWMVDWKKERAYTLEDMARDAIAVLDHAKVEKVHLIGMSMGGMISQRIAISHQERVLSLTSIMSTGYYYDPELTQVPFDFMRKLIQVMLRYSGNLKKIDNSLKLHVAIQHLLYGKGDYAFDTKFILQKAHYELTQRKGYNIKARDQHALAIKKSGSRYQELQSLDLPCLVIYGTNDTLVKFEHGEKYAKMIPGAETLFIEGMGHDLPKVHVEKMVPRILALVERV